MARWNEPAQVFPIRAINAAELILIPRKGELTLETTVVRGQAGVMVRDRAVALETQGGSEDYFPGQSAPAETNLLAGYPMPGGAPTP